MGLFNNDVEDAIGGYPKSIEEMVNMGIIDDSYQNDPDELSEDDLDNIMGGPLTSLDYEIRLVIQDIKSANKNIDRATLIQAVKENLLSKYTMEELETMANHRQVEEVIETHMGM